MATSDTPRSQPTPKWIVEPTATHTYSIILLHGFGSNGEKFGYELLETGVTSTGRKLTQLLPGARFIFPTAKRRRSSAFKRTKLNMWFDVSRLEDPSYRQETQLAGLEDSGREIREIVFNEISKVSRKNVLLGGLSNGCAMSLSVLLTLECGIAGYIGMSGYLPWRKQLREALEESSHSDQDDFAVSFESAENDAMDEDPSTRATRFERDLLCLEPLENHTRDQTACETPVYIGHGKLDEKKPYREGEEAAMAMRAAGYSVDWKLYPDLGHWYKIPDQIDDIANFVAHKVGWEMVVG